MYFVAGDVTSNELCKTKLTESDLHKLHEAIEDLYYFEFVIGRFENSLFTENRTEVISVFKATHLNFLIPGVLCVCVRACVCK